MQTRSTLISPAARLVRSPFGGARLPVAALLPAAALLAACADPAPRELGFTQSAQELSQIPDQPFFSEASEFVGTWVGTAEEPLALGSSDETALYHFPSGSSRISIVIEQPEAQALRGHIRFGAGEPLPPPTDANAGYPAGVSYDALIGYKLHSTAEGPYYITTSAGLPPFEGFEYSADVVGAVAIDEQGLHIGDGVASFRISTNEPLGAWCELQTPHPYVDGHGFSCAPEFGGQKELVSDGAGRMCNLWGPPDESQCLPDLSNLDTCIDVGEPLAQVNCDQLTMCSSGFCDCDETSCWAAFTAGQLTLRRVGNELVGLFENIPFKSGRGLNTPIGEVHLQLE